MTEDVKREQFIKGLREMAAFLEDHSGVEIPYCTTFNTFVHTREAIAAQARLASWEKVYNDEWFYLKKEFSGDIALHVNIDRGSVCRREVVGIRYIEAQPERVEEIVEWVCDDTPLLATK